MRRFLCGIWLWFFAGLCPADTYVRQTSVDVLQYDISLKFSDTSDILTGNTKIHIRMQNDPVTNLALDFSSMVIDQVRVDGIEKTYTHQQDRLQVEFGRSFAKDEVAIIEVQYHGKPDNLGMWIGKNRYHRRVVFTNNWPNYAHHWFPAIDHPYDKAMAAISVTAPAKYTVISNGALIGTEILPDGSKRTRWQESRAIPVYCVAIGIAEFSVKSKRDSTSLPLQWYIFPEDAEAAARKFRRTEAVLEYFKNLIGPFPYEKLAQVQAPIPFEGMENASAIFYDESIFSHNPDDDYPVPHEIAHQWFGDSVTIADWDDLWLSEGFATYFEALFYAHIRHSDLIQPIMENHAVELKKYAFAHSKPVLDARKTDPMEKLNPLTYRKGAWILHMLRGMMGDEKFFEGIRRYYRQYAHSNARSEDFQKTMESVGGMSLRGFFRQWLTQPGWPDYHVQWQWNESTHTVRVSIRQKQAYGLFDMPLDIALYSKNKRKTIQVQINEAGHVFQIPMPVKPDSIRIDPDNWVLKNLKIRTR
jgi:aminopeptidase N